MKEKYLNISEAEYDVQHRIKTLLFLQDRIIKSALLLGSILHTSTLTDVVQALNTMRVNLEGQEQAANLNQSIQISDASRGSERMSEVSNKNEMLQAEEQLLNKITTCQTMLQAVMSALQDEDVNLHLLTAEDVLVLIHSIESDAQMELLHLRLKMALERK